MLYWPRAAKAEKIRHQLSLGEEEDEKTWDGRDDDL